MIERLLVVALALAAVAGCQDPVHDALVASLGGEDPNVPVGPLHRPGQPCLACHDGTGPAALAFGTAGTVFQDANVTIAMASATVTLTDAAGTVTPLLTNCAGNFYIEAVDWAPIFPVHVNVSWGNVSTEMLSHMGKETSCAQCHTGDIMSPSATNWVYLNAEPLTPPPPGCSQ